MFPAPVSSHPGAAQGCAPVESEAFILALANDVLSGVNAAFKMMMISVALVSGVLFASVAIPPRRAL